MRLALLCLLLGTAVFAAAPATIGQRRTQASGVDVAPVFRDEGAFTADVSANGHFAVVFTQPYGNGTDQTPARVEIRNLATGERVTLPGGTSNVGTPGRPAAAFSPDARRVAYTWLDPQLKGTGMLQVIGVESGSQPRTVIPADLSDRGIVPHGWSPDGARILVLVHGASISMDREPTLLAWVNAVDGQMQTITTLDAWMDGSAALPRLSRNGRWIAYSTLARPGSRDRVLHVIDAATGAERQLARMSGSSSSPVWSPDGSHLVFMNRRSGSATADLVAIDVNRPTKPPVRVATAFSSVPITITNNGTLYSMQFDYGWRGYVLQTEAAERKIVDEFSGHGVAWLGPNQLTFGRDGGAIIVRGIGRGTERSYAMDALSTLSPRVIRRDDAAILYMPPYGDAGRPGGGFYQLDFKTGTLMRMFSRDEPARTRSNVFAVSPDNRVMYLGLASGSGRWAGIAAVSMKTGVEDRVIPIPESVPLVQGLALSPEGRLMALHATDGRVFTLDLSSGGIRQLTEPSPGGGWPDVVQWSPDGEDILYGTRSAPASTAWQLMRVKAIGGVPEPAGVDSSLLPRPGRLINFHVSPDTKRLALTIRAERRFDVSAVRDVTSRF